MSKLLSTAVASGLLLACSVGAFAADNYYGMEDSNSAVPTSNYSAPRPSVRRPAPAPPVQSQEVNNSARRFYSYQPPVKRGQRAPLQTFIRPASAKSLGNY